MIESFPPDGRGDERFEYMCDASQLGGMFGFNGLVPPTGPTACQSASSRFLDDGGCYSPYKAVASQRIANMFTKSIGSKRGADCQNFCIEGTYNSDGIQRPSTPCFPCNSGNFSSLKGQSECSICAPGSYTAASDAWTSCSPCERGKFSTLHGASVCSFCSTGKFTPLSGLTACFWCQPGSYSDERVPDACPECPPSSFSNASGVTGCQSCGDGAYTSGFGFSTCSWCAPGTYLVQPAANTSGSHDQKPHTECHVCGVGTYSQRPSGSLYCLPCAAGSFSLAKQSHCALCPGGTFSGNASSMCHDCLPGTFSAVGQSACTACPPGSFSGQRQAVCDLCVEGRYQDRYNATACLSCEIGTYAGSRGMPSCILCEYGKYSIHNETVACSECPPQHNTTGTAKMSPDACIAHCPPGQAGFNGVYPCTTCAPGRYAPTYGTPCVEFEVIHSALWTGSGILDEYYVLNGTCVAHSCPLCQPGKYATNYSQTTCELCEFHFYSYFGQAVCTQCIFGTETLQKGSTSKEDCLSFCAKGTSSVTTQYPCYACAPGKYQDQPAQTSCLECPKQSYMPRFYAPSCKLCPDGKGTLSTGAMHDSECVGWAEKFLDPGICNSTHKALYNQTSSTSYVSDEGALREVDLQVVRNGSGYVDGIMVFDPLVSSGHGAVALFEVSRPQGSIARLSVVDGGQAYTSTGAVTPHFASIEDPLLPEIPQTGSVAALNLKPFVSLQETPEAFMSGCIAGSITVAQSSINLEQEGEDQRLQMLAHYTSDAAGAIRSVCFGQVQGNASSPQCIQNINNHGQDYPQDAELLVRDRGIREIKVRAGSISHGCAAGGNLLAANSGAPSGFFRGSYTVNAHGSIVSASISEQDLAVAHTLDTWAVFPEDVNCACGSGVEALFLNQSGLGFLPDDSGVVFVVPNLIQNTSSEYGDVFIPDSVQGEGVGGAGFQGSFTSDGFGRVSSLSVIHPGQGYAPHVSVALCPRGTNWNLPQACCHFRLDSNELMLPPELQRMATSYVPGTGCFVLHQPRVRVQIGKVGGVPGAALPLKSSHASNDVAALCLASAISCTETPFWLRHISCAHSMSALTVPDCSQLQLRRRKF